MKQLIGVLLAAAAIGGSPPHLVQQSWADNLHGWATDGTVVYGTENGGRSWHRLLRANEEISEIQRTSVRAGFVAAALHNFITIDGGRHWYFADGPGTNTLGQGHVVYWTDNLHVFRLLNWPPRRLRCKTGWIGMPNTFATQPKPHNICDTPTVVHLRSRIVFTLNNGDPNALIGLAGLVPGGFAAFVGTDVGDCDSTDVQVLVYRNGRGILRTLSPPSLPCSVMSPVHLTVQWPVLVVTGPTGYWVSEDGGDTWRFVN